MARRPRPGPFLDCPRGRNQSCGARREMHSVQRDRGPLRAASGRTVAPKPADGVTRTGWRRAAIQRRRPARARARPQAPRRRGPDRAGGGLARARRLLKEKVLCQFLIMTYELVSSYYTGSRLVRLKKIAPRGIEQDCFLFGILTGCKYTFQVSNFHKKGN